MVFEFLECMLFYVCSFCRVFLFEFLFFCKEIILSLFDSDYFFVMWNNFEVERERETGFIRGFLGFFC